MKKLKLSTVPPLRTSYKRLQAIFNILHLFYYLFGALHTHTPILFYNVRSLIELLFITYNLNIKLLVT